MHSLNYAPAPSEGGGKEGGREGGLLSSHSVAKTQCLGSQGLFPGLLTGVQPLLVSYENLEEPPRGEIDAVGWVVGSCLHGSIAFTGAVDRR